MGNCHAVGTGDKECSAVYRPGNVHRPGNAIQSGCAGHRGLACGSFTKFSNRHPDFDDETVCEDPLEYTPAATAHDELSIIKDPTAADFYEGQALFPERRLTAILNKAVFQTLPKEHGAVYNGEVDIETGGKRHGWGAQEWPDGARYEGEWKEDKADGWGMFRHADGDVFHGQWVEGKVSGLGSYRHVDGSEYHGEWLKDKQHGKGIEKWPDGSRYTGEFFEGAKHGFGRFEWAGQLRSKYEGFFHKNNLHGAGRYEWEDGRRYIGEWKHNQMHGHGYFKWFEAQVYEGGYLDDNKSGDGIFRWGSDGRRYVGRWLDGKQCGIAVYVTDKGVKRVGEWSLGGEGKRTRWIRDPGVLEKAIDEMELLEEALEARTRYITSQIDQQLAPKVSSSLSKPLLEAASEISEKAMKAGAQLSHLITSYGVATRGFLKRYGDEHEQGSCTPNRVTGPQTTFGLRALYFHRDKALKATGS